jgi:hypothetical protein
MAEGLPVNRMPTGIGIWSLDIGHSWVRVEPDANGVHPKAKS